MSLKTLNIDSIANTAYAYSLYQIVYTWMTTNEERAVWLS